MSRKGIEEKALPEGWREVKLGAVCNFLSGSGFPEIYQGKDIGDYPFIKVSDMNLAKNKMYIRRSNNWITSEVKEHLKATHCPPNSIVFAKVGAALKLNRRRILTRDTVIDNNMMGAIPKTSEVFPKFLYYYLTTKDFGRFCQESAVPSVNQKILGNLSLKLPPVEYQKVIASLLETWDTAIEKTEALIAAKEKRFKWLLKTLISDQKNNPDWQMMKLGNLFGNQLAIEKGVMLTKAKMSKGNFPVVAGGRTYASFHNECTHSTKTITISSSGAYAGFVGFHDYPIFATDCNVITAISGVIEYFYYAIKMQQDRIYKLQSGGAQPHVYAKDIALLDMLIPPKKTQKQIVCTLNDAQREIALHKQLMELYQRLKSGLMQKLLTGEWRTRTQRGLYL